MKNINKRDMILIGAIILIVFVIAVIIVIPKNKASNNVNEVEQQNVIKGIKVNSTVDQNILQNLPVDPTPLKVLNETNKAKNNDIVVPEQQ